MGQSQPLRRLQHFIGGRLVEGKSGAFATLVDPSTGEDALAAPIGGSEDVDAAMEAARAAFPAWREATPAERSLALWRIAQSLAEHGEELVDLECENTGKPRALTLTEELPPMIDQIRFFAGAARLLEGRAAGEYLARFTSYVRREPIGVCAAVTPWNYPLMMAVWKWAPALAAGNTMVLKPADTTPLATLRMAELMAEHLPAGVFNVLCGDRDTGRRLVAHEVPAMVSPVVGDQPRSARTDRFFTSAPWCRMRPVGPIPDVAATCPAGAPGDAGIGRDFPTQITPCCRT